MRKEAPLVQATPRDHCPPPAVDGPPSASVAPQLTGSRARKTSAARQTAPRSAARVGQADSGGAPPPAPTVPLPSDLSDPRPRRCVLVIPPDEPDCGGLRAGLKQVGLSPVSEVTDALAGAKLAGHVHPDAVVVHWRALSAAVAHDLRQLHWDAVAPVLVYGAGLEPAAVDLALQAEVAAYLPSAEWPAEFRLSVEIALDRWGEYCVLAGALARKEQQLRDRITIERAKDVLMQKKGITGEDAYRLIRETSQRLRIKMVEVARAILLGEEL
jgi:response regulator NasT